MNTGPSQNIAVRFPRPMVERCKRIAQANGIAFADVVRISIKRELPHFESGHFQLDGAEAKQA